MQAKAGPAPWNDISAVSEFTKTGRRRSVLRSGDMEWDLSSGWHYKRDKGWKKNAVQHTSKTVTGLDGKKYKVYSYGGFDDYIGFHAHEDSDNNELQERLAYAEDAFKTDKVHEMNGAGHIASMEYAERSQVLRVTFTNDNAVCLFFRVPTVVAGQLKYLADKGPDHKRSDGRHYLGIEFWNLIRIRGMQHGARYPFEYQAHGSSYKVTRSHGRNVVNIDARSYFALFGKDPGKLNQMNLKPGEKVSVVLSDEELAKLNEEMKNLRIGEGNTGWYLQGHGEVGEGNDMSNITGGNVNSSTVEFDQRSNAELAKLASMVMDDMEQRVAGWKDSNEYRAIEADISPLELAPTKENKAILDTFSEIFGDNVVNSIYNTRTGQIKNVDTYRKLSEMIRVLEGNGLLKTWMHKNMPEFYKLRFTGKVWTPKMLTEFANDTVEGNILPRHAPVYKKLIAAKDWQGALNYLKSHKTTLYYVNRYGQKKELKDMTYASQYDQIGLEE